MDAPQSIGIVGTGLVGTALAGLVARRLPSARLRAVEPQGTHRAAVAARLPKINWAHCAAELADCDLVLLACPPGAVVPLAREILEAGEALVVDTASVKGRICAEMADAPRFVGGHPLAGGNRVGPFTAEPEALTTARFVLTPHPGNAEAELARAESALARLGFTVVRVDPEAHDAILARTSHLPHLLAYGFAGMLAEMDEDELAAFASRSTREIARFASANTRMWSEILEQNGEAVSAALDDLILELMTLRGAFAGPGGAPLAGRLAAAAGTAQMLNGSPQDD